MRVIKDLSSYPLKNKDSNQIPSYLEAGGDRQIPAPSPKNPAETPPDSTKVVPGKYIVSSLSAL
jgi:hypothetical protein